jgi:peptide chain release factor subunit 1
MDLPTALAQLGPHELRPAQRVLSVYLDTSPGRIQREAFLLSYRDGCRSIRPSLNDSEVGAFEAAAKRVEHYLTDEFTPHSPGLALFAPGPRDGLVVLRLPQPPLERVIWENRAEIGTLEAMLDDNERVAVVLFDTERARLFTIFLGAIETRQKLHDHVPGKQATGGWYALQQTRFERHREDRLRRHAVHTVRALMDLLRHRSFDRLLLAGPDEPVAVLRRELPRPLKARLAGTLDLELFANDAEVLVSALSAAKTIERHEQEQLVDELLDAVSTPHVVLGPGPVLDALAGGRVHLLMLADDFAETGAFCSACGRLVTDDSRCPECGGATARVSNLREEIVQQALAQGAKQEMVCGAAAARLLEHGGVGAWTRF